VVAVVDLDILQALLLGRSDGEVRGVVLNLESGRWCGGDVLIDACKVLLEPVSEHDPLLGSWAVVGVHVTGNAPVVMGQ